MDVLLDAEDKPVGEGDHVYLATDPDRAQGTVVDVMTKRLFVLWANGRSWIYASRDLIKV